MVITSTLNKTAIKLSELSRVYQYSNREVPLKDVRELIVSNSGNHRITTTDGILPVIAPGWLAIHIDDGKPWTV